MQGCLPLTFKIHLLLKPEMSTPIEDFGSHIDAMRSLVRYLMVLPQTLPILMTKLTDAQRREIYEPCVLPWINHNIELYKKPDLYVNAPQSGSVEPNPSPLEMSAEIQRHLGKHHPFFDLIHAPLTHPLGTQVSLVSINYCWDAYDTFVAQTISDVTSRFPEHANVIGYKKTIDKKPSTNEKLELLGLAVDDSELAKFLAVAEPDWGIDKARQILTLGKKLRTIFAHHFGKPSEDLADFLQIFPCPSIVIDGDHFEVMLPLVKDISASVQGHALIIDKKKKGLYC